MSKPLKIWNGRWHMPENQSHIYVAAYSRSDARRVILECGLSDPGDHEIKTYWSEGCWGNAMDGITPERGVWMVHKRNSMPRRLKATATARR